MALWDIEAGCHLQETLSGKGLVGAVPLVIPTLFTNHFTSTLVWIYHIYCNNRRIYWYSICGNYQHVWNVIIGSLLQTYTALWGKIGLLFECNKSTMAVYVNSLAPGKFEGNFRHVIFKQILVIDGWGISCKIALIWMSLDFTDDQSTLVQVMAWCRQATSHYLNQCWPRSLLPYGVTRPQWVNSVHNTLEQFDEMVISVDFIYCCWKKFFCASASDVRVKNSFLSFYTANFTCILSSY